MSIEFGRFKVNVNNEAIFIDKFKMAPAETAKVKELIGFAGGMANFNALPPQIGNPPFFINFNEDGEHVLSRADDTYTVSFQFKDVDDLHIAIDEALKIAKDQVMLSPAPKGVGVAVDSLASGEIIEGR